MIIKRKNKITLTPSALDANGKVVPLGTIITWTIDISTALLTFQPPSGAWFTVIVLPTAAAGDRIVTATDGNGIVGTFTLTIPTIDPAPDIPASYVIEGSSPQGRSFNPSYVAH